MLYCVSVSAFPCYFSPPSLSLVCPYPPLIPHLPVVSSKAFICSHHFPIIPLRSWSNFLAELTVAILQESRMLHPKIESSDGVSCRTCSVLLFIFLLIQSVGAQSELTCSHQPVVALAGGDVILPCHLEPAVSASSDTVVWTRPGLEPEYVHVHKDGRLIFQRQNPSYHYRTRLFADELMKGNVSLKIFSVKISDAGRYYCFLESMQKEASIQLTVGAVSSPIIQVVSDNSSSVVLQCESAGWYPEPEVFWLDGEGNLLSAGPTETVRGPDDLYTVSSRVTVEKRHSNNFTCRVQQKDVNQTRDTHIQVTAGFFRDQSSSDWILIINILLCIAASVFILLTFYIYRTRRNKKTDKNNMADCPELSRLTGEKKLENQRATGD
ncbi:butyrophilin subfamily 3 member A2-like isoform X1 [Micropterus salmoides]|uniref:butyrophilin subfamily 3 member A2-like isoform X1 n=2 Tax=Micropterus salmoides TaxID=27706 RepID=UPI0018ED475A|nr:butyrophilin subfamily 3 member A2-like isoform X1 [Micropterus salmoides]